MSILTVKETPTPRPVPRALIWETSMTDLLDIIKQCGEANLKAGVHFLASESFTALEQDFHNGEEQLFIVGPRLRGIVAVQERIEQMRRDYPHIGVASLRPCSAEEEPKPPYTHLINLGVGEKRFEDLVGYVKVLIELHKVAAARTTVVVS